MKIGKVIQYDIHIEPTFNFGFVAKVGCGKFAFTNTVDLLSALNAYLTNPEKFEKEYGSSAPEPEAERTERPLATFPRGRPQTEAEDTCRAPG